MLRNYFLVAIRNMIRERFYSLINILGLTIGIASCLLITIYVFHELSYDRFHDDSEKIFRVGLTGKIADQELSTNSSSPPVAPAMASEITGVESVIRVRNYWGGDVVRYGDNAFTEKEMFLTDSNFFSFFSYELIRGDREKVLKEPNSIVLTEPLARKYFGEEDPIGKILIIGNDKTSMKVTGVCKPAPTNSHFDFDMLVSFSTVISEDPDEFEIWLNNNLFTYIKKSESVSIEDINDGLDRLVEKYVGPEVQRFMNMSLDEFKSNGGKYGYWVYPLTDSHLGETPPDDFKIGRAHV